MLPKIDWITLCNRIRQTSDIPIIMMTAKWDDDDKILWLESWADDYIVKPFKVRELQARIKSISKRMNIDEIIKIWNCEIDFTNKIVKLDGKIISLKLKEFQILEHIYNTKTISKTDLIDYIWWNDDLFGDDNKLDVYIYSIRKKIGKDKIKTIKWFGYSIINENEN
jgi:DNA-binding response OmpR family regulator